MSNIYESITDKPVETCARCGSAYFPEVGCLACFEEHMRTILTVRTNGTRPSFAEQSQPKERA